MSRDDPLSYIPAFQRYTPEVSAALGRIERARGIIDSAVILPAQEDILRRDALAGSVHYSNLIEGNELPMVEAFRAVEQELQPTDQSKLELVNYVEALRFIERHREAGTIAYSPGFLKQLHRVLSKGLGRERADGRGFQPHHEGEWRDGTVVIQDALVVYHTPPPSSEVPRLMEDRLDWLERRRISDDFPAPILAGVAHFEIAEVHPFADYNGRAARLFATAVLFREGFIARRLFSPERYYADDRQAYLDAFRTYQLDRTLNGWLTYFTHGLAHEFERVADRVVALNAITRSLSLPVQLTPIQEQAVAQLTTDPRSEIRVNSFAEANAFLRQRASKALNELVELGIIAAEGTTRDRRFTLRKPPASGTVGRPRKWNEQSIRTGLEAFVKERSTWPKRGEFEAAGLGPLYLAMSRTHGIAYWRARTGFSH